MKRTVIAVLISFIGAVLFAAGEPMAFLKLGAGARATGMGGAYTSLSDDAGGVFYNPAGITAIKNLQVLAETYFLTFGRSVNIISACKPFNLGGHSYSAGLSWLNYSAGSDIEARSTNSPLPERRISDNSHLAAITLGTALNERFYAGFSAKLDLRVIDDVKGTGFGFDAGVIMKLLEGLNAGICASNIAANIWWKDGKYTEPAPQAYSFGFSYGRADVFGVQKLDILMSVDYVLNSFGFMKIKAGAEIKANDSFFLRAGYNGAFTSGFGVVFIPLEKFSVKFDYALVFDTIADASINHRIGATLDFNFDGPKEQKQEQDNKLEEDNEEEPW